ncbi:MAG: ATP-binding protein, partial [Thermodesulfobacteriota bacterium]
LKGGRVLARWNRKLADLMGYDSAEELEGISMRQFHLSEERFLEFGKKYYNSLVSGDHLQAEYQLRRKDGQSLLCLLSGKAIDTHSPPDLNKGVVWIIEDISQRKDMEEELLKVRKLESIGVLAGGIAHDFNNLLSAILGNVELAGRRIADSDEKTSALLSRARKATVRAAKLTDQLLTFSKGGEPIKAKTALPELITETADFVLHGSSVACSYQFPKQLWRVNADSGQISQVIQNIILNTKHAMPDGGTVSISCANVRPTAAEPQLNMEPGDYVRISIEDNGVGIAEGIIDRIFDPYFSTKQEGSGLGLAVCHSIIKKHGGSLTVDSVPGEGTTFTIYLPAIRSKTDTPGTASGIATPAKTAHIMFMDDEKILREVAQAMLTSLEHKAILVEDGEQALNTYQRLQNTDSPVDLVIMDLTIPGAMGGREAAEKLLQLDPQAKIIVASGYSNDPVMANYREYGFDAAVTKPFDLAGLSKVIDSALQGP